MTPPALPEDFRYVVVRRLVNGKVRYAIVSALYGIPGAPTDDDTGLVFNRRRDAESRAASLNAGRR